MQSSRRGGQLRSTYIPIQASESVYRRPPGCGWVSEQVCGARSPLHYSLAVRTATMSASTKTQA